MASQFRIDHQFKLVLIGNSGVGKSALISRFVDDKFNNETLSTIGVDFRFRTLEVEGKRVKLQIWDTAGQEAFKSIISAYYNGAHGVVIVFDLSNSDSFLDMQRVWLDEVRKFGDPKSKILVLGNKCDLTELKVGSGEIQEFKLRQSITLYRETSAKTAKEVEAAFLSLARELLAAEPVVREPKGVKLAEKKEGKAETEEKKKKKNCC